MVEVFKVLSQGKFQLRVSGADLADTSSTGRCVLVQHVANTVEVEMLAIIEKMVRMRRSTISLRTSRVCRCR